MKKDELARAWCPYFRIIFWRQYFDFEQEEIGKRLMKAITFKNMS